MAAVSFDDIPLDDAASQSGALPIGLRGNNPGNIRDTPTPWLGAVGSNKGFEVFDTPEHGIRAMARNLHTYGQRGINTVQGIVGKWSPADAPENRDPRFSTAAYIADVAKEVGVAPDQPLDLDRPEVLQRLTAAMIRHENGQVPYRSEQIASGVGTALPARSGALGGVGAGVGVVNFDDIPMETAAPAAHGSGGVTFDDIPMESGPQAQVQPSTGGIMLSTPDAQGNVHAVPAPPAAPSTSTLETLGRITSPLARIASVPFTGAMPPEIIDAAFHGTQGRPGFGDEPIGPSPESEAAAARLGLMYKPGETSPYNYGARLLDPISRAVEASGEVLGRAFAAAQSAAAKGTEMLVSPVLGEQSGREAARTVAGLMESEGVRGMMPREIPHPPQAFAPAYLRAHPDLAPRSTDTVSRPVEHSATPEAPAVASKPAVSFDDIPMEHPVSFDDLIPPMPPTDAISELARAAGVSPAKGGAMTFEGLIPSDVSVKPQPQGFENAAPISEAGVRLNEEFPTVQRVPEAAQPPGPTVLPSVPSPLPADVAEAPASGVARTPFPRGPSAARPESLFTAIRRLGGVKVRDARGDVTREGSEILNVLGQRGGYLIKNRTGMKPDDLRGALREEGWFGPREDQGADIQDLYDAIDQQTRGQRVYRPEDVTGERRYDTEESATRRAEALSATTERVKQRPGPPTVGDQHQAEVDQMLRDLGHDPLDVAFMSPEERAHAIEQAGRGEIASPVYPQGIEEPQAVAPAPAPPNIGTPGEGASEHSANAPTGVAGTEHPLDEVPFFQRQRKPRFTTEPGAEGLPQLVIPGAEQSAAQLAKAREAAGHGKIQPTAGQKPAEGLFAPATPDEPTLFKRGAQDQAPTGERVRLASNVTAERTGPLSPQERALAQDIDRIAQKIMPSASVKGFRRVAETGDSSAQRGEAAISGATYSDGVRKLIAWSLESPDARGTIKHEAVHWLKESGFFTSPEWRGLERAASDEDWIKRHHIDERYPDLNHAQQIHEAIAEQSAEWGRLPAYLRARTPMIIQKVFERIRLLLQQVAAHIRKTFGADATANDIFSRIHSGEIGKRGVVGIEPRGARAMAQRPKDKEPKFPLTLEGARAAIAHGAPRDAVTKRLKENGIDPAGLSSSQLRPVAGTGELKPRGLSEGIEAKAIENRLTDTFGELPTYQTVNLKDQARLVAELIRDDPDTARSIALGAKAAPHGLIPEMVLKGVEDKAIAEGDVETLRDLATRSVLTHEATTMGQRIRALGERDQASPVAAIQAIQEAREAALKAKGLGLVKETSRIVNDIKREVRRSASKRQTWEQFIDAITCKA